MGTHRYHRSIQQPHRNHVGAVDTPLTDPFTSLSQLSFSGASTHRNMLDLTQIIQDVTTLVSVLQHPSGVQLTSLGFEIAASTGIAIVTLSYAITFGGQSITGSRILNHTRDSSYGGGRRHMSSDADQASSRIVSALYQALLEYLVGQYPVLSKLLGQGDTLCASETASGGKACLIAYSSRMDPIARSGWMAVLF